MLNHNVAKNPSRSVFAEKIRRATEPPPPGSAPGYQLAHQLTPRYTNNVIAGIHAESPAGKKASRDPLPAAASSARTFVSSATSPPVARTAYQASATTIPIFNTNCTRSVTSTPHRPASVV